MATPQKIRCLVQHITNHGDQVYTLDLKPERSVPRFRTGQFLHLTIDDYDPSGFWPESRVFSIASSPALRDHLRISYSVKGQYTSRMEKELRENQWVWVKLPYGDFVIEGTGNTVLLAGGTGITAFISFIAGLPDAFPGRILLAYGARKSELLLYRDVLDSSMAKHQDVKILYFVENGTKNETSTDSLLPFEFTSGCLSIDTFWNDLPDPTSATFYIAGPPAMIRAVSENLTKKNVVPEKIKVDAWE